MFALPPESGEPSETGPKPPSVGETLSIHLLSEAELLELRAEIDQLLPARSLTDLNMERELVIQLTAVQNLQREVLRDQNTPANQKAQTANAVAAVLQTLAKLQTEVFTSERLKQVETLLIETLQQLPVDSQEAFIAAYEAKLRAGGL